VPNNIENDADTYEYQPDVEENTDLESQLRDAAYVLKLTTVHRLPQTVVNDIINETKLLWQEKVDRIQKAVNDFANGDCSAVNRMNEVLNSDMFVGMQTKTEQDKL
jgi:hypothetical protein